MLLAEVVEVVKIMAIQLVALAELVVVLQQEMDIDVEMAVMEVLVALKPQVVLMELEGQAHMLLKPLLVVLVGVVSMAVEVVVSKDIKMAAVEVEVHLIQIKLPPM